MRKKLAFLSVPLLLAGLGACSSDSDDESASEGPAEENTAQVDDVADTDDDSAAEDEDAAGDANTIADDSEWMPAFEAVFELDAEAFYEVMAESAGDNDAILPDRASFTGPLQAELDGYLGGYEFFAREPEDRDLLEIRITDHGDYVVGELWDTDRDRSLEEYRLTTGEYGEITIPDRSGSVSLSMPYETEILLNDGLPLEMEESGDYSDGRFVYTITGLPYGDHELTLSEHPVYFAENSDVEFSIGSTDTVELKYSTHLNAGDQNVRLQDEPVAAIAEEMGLLFDPIVEASNEAVVEAPGFSNFEDDPEVLRTYAPTVEGFDDDLVEELYINFVDTLGTGVTNLTYQSIIDIDFAGIQDVTDEEIIVVPFKVNHAYNIVGSSTDSSARMKATYAVLDDNSLELRSVDRN